MFCGPVVPGGLETMSGLKGWTARLWPTDNQHDAVRQQLMQKMAAAHKSGLLVNLPMVYAIAPAYLFWVDWTTVVLWLIGVTACQVINLLNSSAFLHFSAKGPATQSELNRWTIRFAGFTVLYNIAWASAILLFWVDGNQSNNFFLLCIIAVSVTPTLLLNSSIPANLYASSGVISIFFLVNLALSSLPVALELGIAYTVFLSAMVIRARRAHQNDREMIEMSMEKTRLIDALSDAKKKSDEARAAAEDASRAKSQFLANMSHELRTPLNAIIGFSEVISSEVFGPIENEKYHQYSGDIHSSGRHLLALINDILDLSKIEAGQYSIFEERVDLSIVAEDCHKLLDLRASVNEIKIKKQLCSSLPDLHADKRAVRQIWLNLLTNAVKFAPNGSQVHLVAEYRSDGSFRIGVHDEGPGIAEDELDKVLEKFGQGQEGVSRPGSGTGLGLSIVKGLAEAHGGQFLLESELGVGTRASVVFPRDRVLSVTKSSINRYSKAYP